MPVTLESRTRRMQVFHLPHEVFCRGRCTCSEVTVVVTAENPRTGERAQRQLQKNVPGSITVLARERKPGLPSVVLELAEVKAAIARGYLRIVEQTPDAQPRPDATPPAPSANGPASTPTAPPAASTPTAGPPGAASPATAGAKSLEQEKEP